MWNSIYGEKNSDLMQDLTLMLISEKVRRVKKYPNREYLIVDENIIVIKECLKCVFNKVFNNTVLDNENNILDDYELNKIANDLLYILYTSNNHVYKEMFIKTYLKNINNNKLYLDNLTTSFISVANNVIYPMLKDLFNYEDIFIEDVIFNKHDLDSVTIIAVKFL